MRKISLIGPSQAITGSRHYKWWTYVSISVGLFVVVMDQSGTNIALPRIAEHFSVNIPTVQWITLSYILSISAMLMPLGRLSDMLGRRRVYIAGFLVFIGAAAIGGSAQAFPFLIVAKVIQGIGSAGVQANGLAMVADAFPERERGKALGLYTSIVGVGLISGPAIGGVLVSGLGWRAVFLANIPIGLIAAISAYAILTGRSPLTVSDSRRRGFDWPGAALSSGMLASFLLGLSNAHRFGWGSPPIVASLAIAGFLLAAFVWWQLRTSDPMLDLSLFRSAVFSMGVSTRFLLFLANASVVFLMPFYLIQVLGYRADRAGLMILPYAVGMALTSPVSGRLSDRLGTRWLSVTGMALSASAMFTFSRLSFDSSAIHVIIGMILGGTGMGTFSSANTSAIMGAQRREKYGIVAAFQNLVRNSGNVTGVALATAIVSFTMGSQGYEPSLAAVSDSGGEGVRMAFVTGLNRAFLVSGSLMALAMVVSGLRGEPRRKESPVHRPVEQVASNPSTSDRH
ncbi:MAG: MFS transporter [Dehalococcoidia bacterium]